MHIIWPACFIYLYFSEFTGKTIKKEKKNRKKQEKKTFYESQLTKITQL